MDIQIHEMVGGGKVRGVRVSGISPVCAERTDDSDMHILSCIGTYPIWKSDYQVFYSQYKCVRCDNRWTTRCVAVDGMQVYKAVSQIGA